MKSISIRQRLNRALMLPILLLLAGVAGVAMWMESRNLEVERRANQISAVKDRIAYDVLLVAESLHGLWLDSNSIAAWGRLRKIEADLKETISLAQQDFGQHAGLVSAVRNVQDFVTGNTAGTFGRLIDLSRPEPREASLYYSQNYAAIAFQRDAVLRELADQTDRARLRESQKAQREEYLGLVIEAVLVLLSLVVVLVQSSAIAQPAGELVSALERLRRGDFTLRLPVERRDEFGVLNQGLNDLAEDLSVLVGQVQRSGTQVNTTAAEIAGIAREQQGTAHEIAATTTEIGATSKQISATSRQLVKTMNEVAHVTEETTHLAGSGQSAIGRMELTMRQIMESSGAITAKLAALSDKAANINTVVTTITKVADQTNLLSLNAAIEAEKAGEYGLGFAVVAMEIRRLADQTAVATYDIEKMVKEMHTAVAAGVMGMDKFSEELRRGVDDVRQVGAHLAQIIHQVQALAPRFQAVNEGMHAQAAGAEQISDTLAQLGETARQTVEFLRQSNQAIEQLNDAARVLQTSVARFKLSN
jgi:methyl-accepting chemotaxis protein WspA